MANHTQSCRIVQPRNVFLLIYFVLLSFPSAISGGAVTINSVTRCPNNPLITSESSETIGENINGPAVIKVPNWFQNPLGKYYMYFASHGGKYIRLAYADVIEGPWSIYEPGTLHLDDVAPAFSGHIASPDIYLDTVEKKVYLYFHGMYGGVQETGVAVSTNGIDFSLVTSEAIAEFYLRVFEWRHFFYGITKHGAESGMISRSLQPFTQFERITPIIPHQRHVALLRKGRLLCIFFSRIGSRLPDKPAPERILLSTIDLGLPANQWEPSDQIEVIRPEKEYEGVNYPIEPSKAGSGRGVHQLRDPAIFEENGRYYLFYAIAGEEGIAMAELDLTFNERDTTRIFNDTSYAFDDFSSSSLKSIWRIVDKDEWEGSRIMSTDNTLSLRGRGNKLRFDENKFLGIWRDDINGDFDIMVKVLHQDSTDSYSQCGIMVANNIEDHLEGGLVLLAATPGKGYRFSGDQNEPIGFFDKNKEFGDVRYPCWLRLVREAGTYSGYYKSAGSEEWEATGHFVSPLKSDTDPHICLFMSSNSTTNGTAVLDSFQCWGLDRPLSYHRQETTWVTKEYYNHDKEPLHIINKNHFDSGQNNSVFYTISGRKLPLNANYASGIYLLPRRHIRVLQP